MTQISFHEVCRLWKQEKKMYVKTSTMAAYSLIIQNHLEPQFKTLNEVTTHSVQKMIDRKLKRWTECDDHQRNVDSLEDDCQVR